MIEEERGQEGYGVPGLVFEEENVRGLRRTAGLREEVMSPNCESVNHERQRKSLETEKLESRCTR